MWWHRPLIQHLGGKGRWMCEFDANLFPNWIPGKPASRGEMLSKKIFMPSLDYSKFILSGISYLLPCDTCHWEIVFAGWECQLWVLEPRWPLYTIFPQCLACTSAQDLLHRWTHISVPIGLHRPLETKWRKGIVPALVPLFCTRQYWVQTAGNAEKERGTKKKTEFGSWLFFCIHVSLSFLNFLVFVSLILGTTQLTPSGCYYEH